MAIINVHDLCKEATAYGFGIDKDKTALALRELAGQVEAGTINLQRGRVLQSASSSDFPTITLRLTFAQVMDVARYIDSQAGKD